MNRIVVPNDILLGEASRMLSEGRDVIIMTKGSSMLPFIRGERDSVLLRRKKSVEVGDIVLVRLSDGRYVLHRVFEVSGERVVLMGDGNIQGKELCTSGDVVGTVIEIIRDGSRHVTPGKGRIWRLLLPVRRYLLYIYRHVIL